MKPGNAQLIGLVEERLGNLKDLGRAILAAQQACISADLDLLRKHDNRKESLCAEIRRLDLEISRIFDGINPRSSMRTILDPATAPQRGIDRAIARRLSTLFDESDAARAEVGRLNQVYALFLARSRSTLNVMINVFSHCLGVYPSLNAAASSSLTFERSS